MNFKIKIRPTDTLWTKYIRIRDNYTCKVCGRTYDPDDCRNLGVSHFFNRRKESTRFDDENSDAMCTLPCHKEWEHEKSEGRKYHSFMLNKIGQNKLNILELRSNTYKGRDDKLDKIIISQKIEEL